MSEELYSQAHKYAAKHDITIAEAIREFMRDGLANPSVSVRLGDLSKKVARVDGGLLALKDGLVLLGKEIADLKKVRRK